MCSSIRPRGQPVSKVKYFCIHNIPSNLWIRNILYCNSATDDWRCDQYRWVHNGVTRLPRAKPLVRKFYFSIDTPDESSNNFTRHAYMLPDSDDKVYFVVGALCVCVCVYVRVCVCVGRETDKLRHNAKMTARCHGYLHSS